MAAAKKAPRKNTGGKINLRPSAKKEPVARIPKMADTKVMGLEPSVDGVDFETTSHYDIGRCYNWYNYFHGVSEAKGWAVAATAKTDPTLSKLLAKVPEPHFSTTVGWLYRMESRGAILGPKNIEWRAMKVEEMVSRVRETVTVAKAAAKKSGPEYKQPGYQTDIETFEAFLDTYYKSGYVETFVAYDYLSKNNVKKTYATAIAEYYRPLLEELKVLTRGKDKDLNEAYNHLTKKQKEDYLKFIFSVVEDCERWATNKTQIARVARTPRKKSAEQILKTFKYKKDNTALKVVSIDPSAILGAKTLLAFNDKYRKIMVFHAKDGETLSVKGASLTGVDEVKSGAKTLRKPEVQLQAFTSGTATFMMKRYEEINSKPSVPSTRITTDVLLLKVFK